MRAFNFLPAGLLALFSLTLPAATLDELKRECAAFNASHGFDKLKSCAVDVFTAKPLHPIVRNIVPGGGTGMGLNLTLDSPKGEWHRVFTTEGAISFRDFWIAESRFSLIHPKFGEWNTARDDFAAHFYVRARGLPRMPFYGIGPKSSKSNLVDFSQRDTAVGANAVNPLASWFGIGGTVEGVFPDVSRISDPKIRSIEKVFPEDAAPGLVNEPSYLHTEAFIRLHHADPFEFDSHVGYNFYHDTKSGLYAFRRFRADLRQNIYPERSGGIPKRDSFLSIHALLSMSDSSAANRTPFYMQETLGGSDINGQPTLRGFSDYRFRGPNLILFQVQYDKRLWRELGGMAFYDTGKVTVTKSDLDFSNFRHSFGFGGNIWVGGKVVFRAYVGLGSGEGVHPFFGITTGI